VSENTLCTKRSNGERKRDASDQGKEYKEEKSSSCRRGEAVDMTIGEKAAVPRA